jgi:hypothetical protein
MVATRLKYNLTAGTHYIDLFRDLSEYHRKLHRQKQIATVYGGFIRNNNSASAKFNVAPLTWQSKTSVNRTFKLWRKMISETLKRQDGLQTGKWNDFKVYLDNVHGTAGTSAQDAAGNRMSNGEWDYSTLTQPQLLPAQDAAGNPTVLAFDADADQWEVHIVGPHAGAAPNYTRVGMLQSWTDSRSPTDSTGTPVNIPNIADPLSNLFEVEDNDEEKITIIEGEGDLPPYHRTIPYGVGPAALAPVSIADNGASDTITPVGNQVHGFQALCGLVQVVVSGSGTTELFLDVESQGESF